MAIPQISLSIFSLAEKNLLCVNSPGRGPPEGEEKSSCTNQNIPELSRKEWKKLPFKDGVRLGTVVHHTWDAEPGGSLFI